MTSATVEKFAGSKIEVQTGFGTPKTITGITKALPAIVSATAHGFLQNAVVKLLNIDGMKELSNNFFAVGTPIVSGSFALLDTDTTGMPSFVTDSPNDAQAVPVVFTESCQMTGLQKQGASANQTEVSTICSTVKEFVQGLADTGTWQLDYYWTISDAVQQAIDAAEISGNEIAFRFTDPDGNVAICFGTVQQTSWTGSVSSVVFTGSATIKLSGITLQIPAA